jgi:hypothetical protein
VKKVWELAAFGCRTLPFGFSYMSQKLNIFGQEERKSRGHPGALKVAGGSKNKHIVIFVNRM